MLMRSDPFRDFDRLAQQVLGTAARPAVMPMDAWREGDKFIVEFDLPGVDEESLNLDVERNHLRPGDEVWLEWESAHAFGVPVDDAGAAAGAAAAAGSDPEPVAS